MKVLTKFIPIVALSCFMVSGCANPKAILKSDGATMRDLIEDGRRVDVTNVLNRHRDLASESWQEIGSYDTNLESYTRDANNEINQLFPILKNPQIAIYVYPHLATGRRLPVPGYTTALPLYERYEYALPSEAER